MWQDYEYGPDLNSWVLEVQGRLIEIVTDQKNIFSFFTEFEIFSPILECQTNEEGVRGRERREFLEI